MILLILFIGIAVSFGLVNYFNRKREQRQEEAKLRREGRFLNLLQSLKKGKAE